MTNVSDNVKFTSSQTTDKDEENFENPIDISDIINVCKEYSRLGWQIQHQIECITETGIEEAIKSGTVKITSLPLIKHFLQSVSENPLFGDASYQANECIALIENYELTHPRLQVVTN